MCPKARMENGYCLDINNKNQKGELELKTFEGNTEEDQANCLKLCREHSGATGCQFKFANRKCYVHIKPVSKGNGMGSYLCWIFTEC